MFIFKRQKAGGGFNCLCVMSPTLGQLHATLVYMRVCHGDSHPMTNWKLG